MKIVFALSALVMALGLSVSGADAQQPGKAYRIGYLLNAATIGGVQQEAFKKRLQELGYAEGQNLTIHWAFTKGDRDRVPGLVAELVNLKPDCIVAVGVGLTRAVKQATGTIPIVMANADEDPVQQGLVSSLARPGGNVTGFTNIGSDLAGKRLELLKETVPKATRIAIVSAGGPGASGHIKESQSVAPTLGIRLQSLEVPNPEPTGIERAFKDAVNERANALVVVNTGGITNHRAQIASSAVKTHLPAMYTAAESVRDGGLMSYADDPTDRSRRVAEYVDRILKGTKPGDLPVQRPMKFELIINLNAAKQIGLTIPPSVLARADRVIK